MLEVQKCSKERFAFLGLHFHSFNFSQAHEQMEGFIASKRPHMVFMPTAELIVRAKEDSYLRDIYNQTHLLLIDSYVVYYAARLFGKSVSEPVNGARLMFSFLDIIHKKGYSIYILGAEKEVLLKAVENLKKQYPGINIAGFHHGYFDFKNDSEVVQSIKESNPDVLFVAMSSPLKENFTAKNLEKMNVPVCMGVGGSIDVISGEKRMSPLWISKMGLEWFYRLVQDPKRLWKRYTLTNIRFLCLLVKDILKIGNRNIDT